MKKILIPNDLSDLSIYSFEIANRVAKACGAEIEVLGVVPAPTNAEFDSMGMIKTDAGLDYSGFFAEQEVLQQKLEAWAKSHELVTKVTTQVGDLNNAILRYADNNAIDMIAMGVVDMHGVSGKLIDSYAQQVVRNASIPVLTLKCDRSGYELNDLLFVHDFSGTEKLNLGVIIELIEKMDLTVHLLEVSTPKHFVTTMEGKARMETFAEINDLKGAKCHVYSAKNLEDGISYFSVETGIDFVAIGTHQRKGVRRVLKGGSLAEDVVNHLYQPILTFKL